MTDAPTAGNTVRSPGWLRRNRWGIVALLPAAVFAVAFQGYDAYTVYRDATPRVPITGHAPAWVAFEGANARLDSLSRVTSLQDDLGSPVAIPAGMTVWRATLEFRATNWSAIGGCTLTMEDAAGATYGAGPAELTDLGADINVAMCTPDSTDSPPTTWKTEAYFVAPSGAHPVAVRISTATSRVRYARLTPP